MRLPLLLAILAAAAPAGARAGDRAVVPSVALRLGVGAALGSATRDVPMTDVVAAQYPAQLDVLGAWGPVAVGAYGALGLATAGRCGHATCSAWTGRLGLQATWTFVTAGGSEPWVGVASGYEWVSESRTQGGTVATRWRGLEPFAIQGGWEWRVLPWLTTGPYALLSFGSYARYTVDTGIEQATVAIPHQTVHAWFHLGVRGRIGPEVRR